MNQHSRTVPRALHRARLWTAGLLTASTLLVGGVGIHLAQDQAQAVAARTSASAGSSNANVSSSSSSSSSGSSNSSNSSGSQDSGSQSGGFGAVAPLFGSNAQPQSNSAAS